MKNYETAKRRFMWSMGVTEGQETLEQSRLFDETISADYAKFQDACDDFVNTIKGYIPWLK